MLLEGKKVFVGPFLKRTDRPADKEAHYTNIYVKNVAESVTEEQLEKMFAEHGKVCLLLLVPGRSLLLCVLTSVSSLAIISAILHSGFSLHAAARTGCAVNLLLLSAQVTSCMIMKDDEGKSRGFGFVNFDDADAAHQAVEALNGKDIDGKELYAGRAQKKSEREAELKQKYVHRPVSACLLCLALNVVIC